MKVKRIWQKNLSLFSQPYFLYTMTVHLKEYWWTLMMGKIIGFCFFSCHFSIFIDHWPLTSFLSSFLTQPLVYSCHSLSKWTIFVIPSIVDFHINLNLRLLLHCLSGKRNEIWGHSHSDPKPAFIIFNIRKVGHKFFPFILSL